MVQVLLVEDDTWLGELYVGVLQKAGFEIDWQRDAYGAMDSIERKKPAVIVLDLLLPWGNGVGLLHELASHVDLASIPTIVCSNALPKDISAQNLQQYGVVSVVDKTTSTPRQLVRAVREASAHASLSN